MLVYIYLLACAESGRADEIRGGSRTIRQNSDVFGAVIANILAPVLQMLMGGVLLPGFGSRVREAANFFGGAHRFERARDDLRGAGALHIVGRLRFEEFRVGQNDPELIVQAVVEEAQFG